MDVMDKVRAWRWLEHMFNKIQDTLVRNAVRLEFMKRARTEWGFCPIDTKIHDEENIMPPDLTEEERMLCERIQAYLEYGVDIMTEEEKRILDVKTLNHMIDFIEKGHTYWEIPEEIQCDSLKEIYDKAFDIVFNVEKFTKNA